jgi:hypothetical protein
LRLSLYGYSYAQRMLDQYERNKAFAEMLQKKSMTDPEEMARYMYCDIYDTCVGKYTCDMHFIAHSTQACSGGHAQHDGEGRV